MGHSDFRLHHAAYQRGLSAGRYDANPYYDDARAPSWNRGHRDRWLHGVKPDNLLRQPVTRFTLGVVTAILLVSLLRALV